MSLPKQAPPVRRPEIIEPHRVVEVEKGTSQQLLRARLLLLHAANYNDPAPYAAPLLPRMRASAQPGAAVAPAGRRVQPQALAALAAATLGRAPRA
jgi:cyanobactin biosynthesis protein (PatB/AcyB/McaB family)